jgi:hypothetical protein
MPVADQLRDAELDRRDLWGQAPQPSVVLRLVRQTREVAWQQSLDRAEELAVGHQACDGLGDRQRDQLLVGDLAGRAWARNRQRAGEYVACDNEGLQRSVHLVVQSRVDRAGGPLLM